ncbi:MAG: hypothetical protein HDT21_12700 [Ruminococcus sp.]|nr:hypothetical protein [Ruminococcus sp.]
MFAPPRNAFAFLTSCSVSEAMRLRAQERNFALCGARPKGAALWTSAAFEKAGETFPYETFCFDWISIIMIINKTAVVLVGLNLLKTRFRSFADKFKNSTPSNPKLVEKRKHFFPC